MSGTILLSLCLGSALGEVAGTPEEPMVVDDEEDSPEAPAAVETSKSKNKKKKEAKKQREEDAKGAESDSEKSKLAVCPLSFRDVLLLIASRHRTSTLLARLRLSPRSLPLSPKVLLVLG